jgi:hypothetical protein
MKTSSLDLNLPLTYPYSNAITVCLVRKNWVLALRILDDMEEKNITRNVVTMNSIRSELVYQSALRSGIYNHWHQTSSNIQHNPNSDLIMDLHTLPLSSARCAVMHVLGEIASSKITLTNSLIIITGRGNGSIRREGVLKVEILAYLSSLGLLVKKQQNSGRIELSNNKNSTVQSGLEILYVVVILYNLPKKNKFSPYLYIPKHLAYKANNYFIMIF